MKTFLWLCVCVSLFGGLAAGTLACCQACKGTGVDFWNLPGLLQNMEGEKRRDVELDQIRKERSTRLEAKDRIVRNLIDGQLTLHVAILRFRPLHQQSPAAYGPWVQDNLDLTTEGIGRHILNLCETQLRNTEPERLDEVMARLRGELAALRPDRQLEDRPGGCRKPVGCAAVDASAKDRP